MQEQYDRSGEQNPAHAGMNPSQRVGNHAVQTKPRSRGDEPLTKVLPKHAAVKTPLTRG